MFQVTNIIVELLDYKTCYIFKHKMPLRAALQNMFNVINNNNISHIAMTKYEKQNL